MKDVSMPTTRPSSVTSTVSTELDTTSTVSGSVLTSSKGSLGSVLSLREVWEIYIRAVKSQDQGADNVKRQGQLLNLLLHMCATEMAEGGVLPDFSDMKSVCNQLCKEYMSDILHITSRSDDDDATELRKYLLEGRGFLIMQVLHQKGVQTVSSCRELANLLVSLLPWCLKFPLRLADGAEPDLADYSSLPPISHCFQNILRANQGRSNGNKNQAVPRLRQIIRSPQDLGGRNFTDTNSSKRKYFKRKSPEEKEGKGETDKESSTDEIVKSRGKIRRRFRYYRSTAADHHIQQKADSDSDDDDLTVILKSIKCEENKTSGFELCVLVSDLLFELSLTDTEEQASGILISPSVLPHLLQCLPLCGVTDQVSASPWELEARKIILRHMLRAVFSMCSVVASQPTGMNILIGHKFVKHVLKVISEMDAPESSDEDANGIDEDLHFNKRSLDVVIQSDAVMGVVLCLNIVFENLPFNLSFIKTAVSLIEQFEQNKGFYLLKQCILYSDWLKLKTCDPLLRSGWLEDEPVRVFGTFLNTMKVVRVNYLHSMKCVKRKHHKCTYAQYFDHHHDILGLPVTMKSDNGQGGKEDGERVGPVEQEKQSQASQNLSSKMPVCLVATCTDILLDLLIEVTSKTTRLEILKTVYSSGVCCCMSLDKVISSFVVGVRNFSPAVRTYALDTLNKIILEHFSGSIAANCSVDSRSLSCSQCDSMDLISGDQVVRKPKLLIPCFDTKGLDSGFDSNDALKDLKISALNKILKWKPLAKFRPFLYVLDEALSTSVAKHLMVLAIKGNPYLKCELFFSLYVHALDSVTKGSTSDLDIEREECLSKTVQVHCLSALPYLLQANCVMKAFLKEKGVRKLCEFLEDDVLRSPILRIFEALIVLDEQRLDENPLGSSTECPCPYGGGLVIDAFLNELSKRSFDNESDTYHDSSDQRRSRIRKDSIVLSKFSLPVLVDLWESCAKLCLHNRTFTAQFYELCFRKTECLLLETLDILISPFTVGFTRSDGSLEADDSGLEGEQAVVPEVDHCSSGFYMRISLLESLLVVISACQKYVSQTGMARVSTWEQVKERFSHRVKLEPNKLKMLLDTMMAACMPHFISVLQYSYSKNVALVYVRDDDIYDEDEVRHLLHTVSDEEHDHNTEVGYDADSEGTVLDDSEKDKHMEYSFSRSLPPQRVYFPEMFGLLIDVLVLLSHHDNQTAVGSILHKLLQSARADMKIVHALCKQNVLSVLLDKAGFWPALVNTESSVQENVLGLVQQLGQHKLKSHDLQRILQLFQYSSIPMEQLLAVFQSIVENSAVMSYHSVEFPAQALEGLGQNSALEAMEDRRYDTLMGSVSPLLKSVSSLFMLGVSPLEQKDMRGGACVTSRQKVWETCALYVGLKDLLVWPPFQNGITVTLWLHVKSADVSQPQNMPLYNLDSDGQVFEDKTRTGVSGDSVSGCLHVLSLGTTDKLLEIWTDAQSNSVVFRLTSDTSDMGLVIQESKLTGVLSPDRWQHLIFSYVEKLDGSTLTGKACLVIDGCQRHYFTLDHPFSAVRSRHGSASQPQPHLCMGHVTSNHTLSQLGHLALGNVMVFKGGSVSKELCFHLYTLGPDGTSILKCDCSTEKAFYAPHLHKHTILHSKIDHDTLVGLKRPDLAELRASLLLLYNPSKCDAIASYPSVTKGSQSHGYTPNPLLTQKPKWLTFTGQGHVRTKVTYSLEKAIEESGGMAAILFLVAKVYERCPEKMCRVEAERIQCAALRVLFTIVHHSCQLQEEYINIGGHALLCKVLTSCRSVVGQHILKVLMDAATTESLYKHPSGAANMLLRTKCDAVIRDVSILEQLVLNWQVWERGGSSVTELLFAGMASLIHEDHPHQGYNVKQYQVINLVNKIFKVYQERIQESFSALPVPVSKFVISIIQNMTGSPPDYHLILDICDFLLHVHPAAKTYIHHSRTGSYFSFPWGLPPSPLTMWKQGLATGGVRNSGETSDKAKKQAKKNQIEAFEQDPEVKEYPSLVPDVKTSVVKPSQHDRHQSPSSSPSLIPDIKPSTVVKPSQHDRNKSPSGSDSGNKSTGHSEHRFTLELQSTHTQHSQTSLSMQGHGNKETGGSMVTCDIKQTGDKIDSDADSGKPSASVLPRPVEGSELEEQQSVANVPNKIVTQSVVNVNEPNKVVTQSEVVKVNEPNIIVTQSEVMNVTKDQYPSAGDSADLMPSHADKSGTDSVDQAIDKLDTLEITCKDDLADKSLGQMISSPLGTQSIPGGFEKLYKQTQSFDDAESDLQPPSSSPTDMEADIAASDSTGTGTPMSRDGLDLTLKFDEDNVEMLKQEQGLTALCVGLLQLLSSIIRMMPDTMANKTFQKSIINPQTFIVLAQNSSAEIRESVIKMVSSYLERSSTHHVDAFLKMEGFHLLSAQLFQYPTHQEQMEAAIALLMQRPFSIDEGLYPDETIDELSRVQQSSVTMVLSLLGNCTGDLALCHNSIQFCCKLFETSDIVATVMVEQGIVEVLCNMLLKLFDSGTRETDVEGMDENEILLQDILKFFTVIATREFSASGPQHYQHFEDLVTVLQEMESIERQSQGMKAKSTQTLRTFQQHIHAAVLGVIEKASEEVSQQGFSLFSKASPVRTVSNYDASPSLDQHHHHPGIPAHKHPSSLRHHLVQSGQFGRIQFQKKSAGGYFAQSDHPFSDISGGGTDSDSSQDSFQTSVQTVNLPIVKPAYHRAKSLETSQGGRLVRSHSLLQTVLSIGKRKKLSTIPMSQNELIERLKKMVTFATDSVIFTEGPVMESGRVVLLFETIPASVCNERKFIRRLFIFMYRAFEETLPQEKSVYKRNKNVIMWGGKDVLRVQLGRLLSYMMSDRQEFEQRIYALSFMMGEPRGVDVLRLLISAPDLGNDLGYYIRDLMVEEKRRLSRQQVEDGARLINHLSSAGIAVFSPRSQPTMEQQEILHERKKLISFKLESQKTAWLKKNESSLNRIFHQYDSLSSRLCDNAMEVTQSVTQLQTQERNKFITHIKQKKTESIQVKKQWQEIVQNLTHERAVWFDKMSYPQSWQLNPTEGPIRVRKRLQRGHLGIQPRFLRSQTQYKLATETVDPPLIYLFEDDHQMSDSAALIYQLHKNKKIRYTSTCRAVSPNSETKGELLIGEDSVFFVADEAITDANYTQVLLGNKDQLSMTWPFEDIVEIKRRWFELTDTALEIFLTNGKTCLLALSKTKERDDLFQHLSMLELPNKVDSGNLFDILDRWLDGHITNFEYLTLLNKVAGRSFSDLMQYPVMPFILRDYTSPDIDLRDMLVYRDLSKPVSVQDPRNEAKFKEIYDQLKRDYDKGEKGTISGMHVGPFHYGSHYSSSGVVLHFLVRQPPFTKMFLSFQDQSFDIPDRTFHNLNTSWRLVSAESNTDVKELIPEFFCCHEFLRNPEGFDFGVRQTGDIVDDVVLPPWCGGNPRLFVLVHRQALESDYVTENIGSWIDLVFGFKQRGEAAVKAFNVFHPATYYGLDVSSVKNQVDKLALQAMVRTYGQTPRQLFKLPHPRKPLELIHHADSHKSQLRAPTLPHVRGLKWGSYLGSPDKQNPDLTWEVMNPSQVASLVALPTGSVFGISSLSCLLVQHNQDKQKLVNDSTVDIVWAAIVTWGQMDGVVRIINGTNKPPVNFITYSQSDEVTCCASVPDCRYLFMGRSSGVITIYNTKYNPAKESELQVFGHKRCLYGHTDSITSLIVCKPYSILVSASEDSTCIIWDLNRLSYVRSISCHTSGVQVLAVSDTLGDIASVSHHGMGSHLYLHTVNAELVAKQVCKDTINCLAYSTAPEGISVNVIAGGLSSGTIRLWSSWDLTVVRDLTHANLIHKPIISLTYTKDSQKLYASSVDGRVVLWEYGGQGRQKSHRFRPFLYPY